MNSNAKQKSFVIGRLLGRGGYGAVYLGTDEGGKEYAVKRYNGPAADDEAVSRFRREAEIQSLLKHRNIVKVIASKLHKYPPSFAMPLADKSLCELIVPGGVDSDVMTEYACQLMSGLSYAHDNKVLHRDIKPSNILVYGTTLKLADFGLGKAKYLQSSLSTDTHDAVYSPWFASPEQRDGLKRCDERSDIFSFGKLLLNCLTGSMPDSIPDSLDKRWRYIIKKCLRHEPGERWQSVAQLQEAFDLIFELGDDELVDETEILEQLSDMASVDGDVAGDVFDEFVGKVELASEDDVIYKKIIDSLPRKVARAWVEYDKQGFVDYVIGYDRILPDGLVFSYCDVIADQYAAFLNVCDDSDLFKVVCERLFNMGPWHNRWHVGQVLGGILAKVDGQPELGIAVEILESDKMSRKWLRKYVEIDSLHLKLRRALKN